MTNTADTTELADERPIRLGAVLRHVSDGERGVVVEIARSGELCRRAFPLFPVVGEICIRTSPGVTRVTNCHSEWTHIPSAEQSYEERFLSWMVRPYEHDEDRPVSYDTGLAIDGIMALLPVDTVDWECGPWPDTLENALRFLTSHLTALTAKSG